MFVFMALFHQFVYATILNLLLEKFVKPNVKHQFHHFSPSFFLFSFCRVLVFATASRTTNNNNTKQNFSLFILFQFSLFFFFQSFLPFPFLILYLKINLQHHRKLQSKEVGSMPVKVMTLNWPVLYMVTLLPM